MDSWCRVCYTPSVARAYGLGSQLSESDVSAQELQAEGRPGL